MRWLRSRRGGAIVETAVMVPVLIILMVGIVQVGALVNVKLVVSEAAREAAREYATYAGETKKGQLCPEGLARATSRAADIVSSIPYGGGFEFELSVPPRSSKNRPNVTVTVKVCYACPVFVPGIGRLVSDSPVWEGNSVVLTGRAIFNREMRDVDRG